MPPFPYGEGGFVLPGAIYFRRGRAGYVFEKRIIRSEHPFCGIPAEHLLRTVRRPVPTISCEALVGTGVPDDPFRIYSSKPFCRLCQPPSTFSKHGRVDFGKEPPLHTKKPTAIRCRHGHKKRASTLSGEALTGTSMGTRTPVFAVRGRRLNRLTMEAYWLPN